MEVYDIINNHEIETEVYSDDYITLTNKELKIRKYYYPFNKIKTIKLKNIRRIKMEKLGYFSGAKFYGLSFDMKWYNFDIKRPQKKICFIIDDESVIKPAITPDYPNEFYNKILELIKK